MKLDDFRFDGKGTLNMKKCPASLDIDNDERPHYEELAAENSARMVELQDKLYAEGKEGVVIMVQAMDAAGKDSVIKHVMSGLNPQGVKVCSFKTPTPEELAHDYLWRAVRNLPERGSIGLFNRSYYEDVLVVRVHKLKDTYSMPDRTLDMDEDEFFERRYKQISNFEEYLWENGYRLLKIMLNVSLDKQKERFLERIDDESKNWKFSAGDLRERALWPEYMDAYEKAINGTASKHAPWYVIPADQKWITRYLVSEAVVKVLEDCDPHYPDLPDDQRATLQACREQLLSE